MCYVGQSEEARIAKEVEAHEKRIRKELEKQDMMRRKVCYICLISHMMGRLCGLVNRSKRAVLTCEHFFVHFSNLLVSNTLTMITKIIY